MNKPDITPHQLTKNVKFLHKAVVIVNGKALILRRNPDSKSRPSCWDLPGGNSEWPSLNQSSQANLHQLDVAREIEEETGLVVASKYFTLDALVYFSSYFASDKQIYTIICGWQTLDSWIENSFSAKFPEVIISDEHTDYVWVSEAELANYDFGGVKGQFVVDIIKAAFNNKK